MKSELGRRTGDREDEHDAPDITGLPQRPGAQPRDNIGETEPLLFEFCKPLGNGSTATTMLMRAKWTLFRGEHATQTKRKRLQQAPLVNYLTRDYSLPVLPPQ